MDIELNLSKVFKNLYKEFVVYLNKTGLVNDICIVMEDNPIIDFQTAVNTVAMQNNFGQLESLPSYRQLIILVSQIQNITEEQVEKSKWCIFTSLFSEVANHISPIKTNYKISYLIDLERLEFDEKKLSQAILEAPSRNFVERTNKYLLIYENLETEIDIDINDKISLIKLNHQDIESKLRGGFDTNKEWARVTSAFVINDANDLDSANIAALSTLLRLYKKGDIRFKGIFQSGQHFMKGEVYVKYKSSLNEEDYYENEPSSSENGWFQYLVRKSESINFANFIGSNLAPMSKMAQSCRMYNMVFSSPLHLKIPLLFFVIESFFSDIESEVVFKISLYLTILFKEDKNFIIELKKLYAIRSCIAHGDLAKAEKQIKKMKLNSFGAATRKIDDILNRLWKILLEKNWDPKQSKSLMDDLIFDKNNYKDE